ncbi:hypothetical protein GNI_114080 [Gregarina niphandrodes]|uniref:Uncharacterized protein n=1 Tax=Gregarina niphandrodes TaxID=110365 RepID=A0A023B3H9_GRENI|nr:hypothetical protein GNI_114080 [Gregarina niphandrodes]EZG55365.1 hypothetical protein GNI_114080 [Gregarina niphandrodes]|eukprot:XP_011131612.1 hypothetical protein GNI_114080 [Gregarina niphandrodes]
MNTVPHSISDDEDADRAASIMVSNLVEEPNPHLHGSGYSEQYRLGRNDRSRDNPDESKATSCPPIKDRKFSEPGHDPDPSCNRDLDLLDRDLDFDLDLDQDQDLDLDQDQDLDLEPSRTEEEDPGMQDHGMQHPRVRDPPIQDPSVQDTAQATDYAVEAEAEEGERRGRVDGSSRPSSPAGSDDDRRDVGRRRPRRFRQLAAQGTDLMADQRNRFRRKSPEGPAPVQTTSVPSDDTLSPGKDDGDGRDRGRERSREGGRGEDAACVSRFMAPSSLLDSPLWSAVESTLPNFRDIAISSCTLGIKTGRLFRSARPFGDYSTLHGVLVDGLKIHTIIDLRDDNLLAIRGEEESRLQVSQLYLLSHVTQKGHTTSRSGYRTPPSRWRSPKKNNRRGLADDARMMEDVYREASVEEFAYKIKGLPSALAEEIIDNQELYPLFETFMRPELKHALVVNVLE